MKTVTTTWRCDRCQKETIQDIEPEFWIKANTSWLRANFGPESSTYHWCESCWQEIKRVLPKEL